MSFIFLTGFPGFLCSALVKRLLERDPPDCTLGCLVQSKFRGAAVQKAEELTRRHSGRSGRIELLEGDIRMPDLGLGSRAGELQAKTVRIYHLAAAYDLAVAREPALAVNVEGTNHVLAFAARCPNLRRFHYVSTCYVSGRHRGAFGEHNLEEGQVFNNHYEETKYLAELAVQRQMRAGLPVTIYRPSIVVGDSRTGATQKYDGPYGIIGWILKQPRLAVLPVVGDPVKTLVNLVPRDFVIDALASLSAAPGSIRRVYQLCDPDPPSVDALLRIIGAATGRRLLRLPLPKTIAKASLNHLPGLRRWMGIEPASIDYFDHPTRYTCENTLADLEGTGIACPPFSTYAARLVEFMKQHRGISPAGMF